MRGAPQRAAAGTGPSPLTQQLSRQPQGSSDTIAGPDAGERFSSRFMEGMRQKLEDGVWSNFKPMLTA